MEPNFPYRLQFYLQLRLTYLCHYIKERKIDKIFLLNPHSGQVKLDAYLPQFLCHMTFYVKFLHMFFFLFTLFKSLQSKRTLTIKQILIFSETKKKKNEKIHSHKYIHRKTVMVSFQYSCRLEGLQFYEKGNPSQMLFCEICKVLQNLIFTEDSCDYF